MSENVLLPIAFLLKFVFIRSGIDPLFTLSSIPIQVMSSKESQRVREQKIHPVSMMYGG